MSSNVKTEKSDTPAIFLVEADHDYIIARLISFTGLGGFSRRAGYFAQQALEKYLKALSVQLGGEYLKSHNLKDLAAHCAQFDTDFTEKELIEHLTIFDDFTEVGRYGGAASYDPHAIKTPEIQSWGASSWHEEYRALLDGLVFFIRGKLDTDKMGFTDSLQAILKEDQANLLVGSWQLPTKLREVLTAGNTHFKQ